MPSSPDTCWDLCQLFCFVGAETERCSRHDGFYPKQMDLYRQFFIIRTSFVRKVLNICPILPFQAPKNSLYIFWKWDSLMPISPYIKMPISPSKVERLNLNYILFGLKDLLVILYVILFFDSNFRVICRPQTTWLIVPAHWVDWITDCSFMTFFDSLLWGQIVYYRQWISTWNWYTGVPSLVHYLLHHVTAYACRHKFGPLTFSSKFLITW